MKILGFRHVLKISINLMKRCFPPSLIKRISSKRDINIDVNIIYIPFFHMLLARFSWKMYFIFLAVLMYFDICWQVKKRRAEEHWQPFVRTPLSLGLPKAAKCFSTDFSKFVTVSTPVHTCKNTQNNTRLFFYQIPASAPLFLGSNLIKAFIIYQKIT